VYVSRRLPVAIALVSAVVAVVPVESWIALVVAIGAIGGLVVADVRLAADPRTLQLRREVPVVMRVGVPADVSLSFHNPLSRRLALEIRDATPPSMDRTPIRHRVAVVPGGWATLDATVRPARRGYSRLGPAAVRTSGPLGLAGRQGSVPLEERVKVYPSLPARAEIGSRLERARALHVGERSSAARGGGTDFDSLREYHPDDEFRRINWRATARRAKPITNVYREDRNQQVVLLLDAGRTMAGTVGGVARFEHGIDAAFALTELATRGGDHVGLVAFAGDVLAMVAPRGGPAQPRRVLDAMFDLEPRLGAADYVGAFAAVLSRYRRRSLLVLLTELTSEAVLESLYAALPSLLGRHLVVVGAIRDPEVQRLAEASPLGAEDAYLKAAATAAELERERAAWRLQRMGVIVEDHPPGRVAGALADRYLRIKALGRL
jgi:uncharacterized protein (DUF58 family)